MGRNLAGMSRAEPPASPLTMKVNISSQIFFLLDIKTSFLVLGSFLSPTSFPSSSSSSFSSSSSSSSSSYSFVSSTCFPRLGRGVSTPRRFYVHPPADDIRNRKDILEEEAKTEEKREEESNKGCASMPYLWYGKLCI